MKRLAFLAMLILVLTTLGMLPASAAEVWGDFEYTVLKDGTVRVDKYTGSAASVTVPGEIGGRVVTEIGREAFRGNTKLMEIALPDSLETLGYCAFFYCENLTSINYPRNLKSANSPFTGCTSLTEIIIPEDVTVIPTDAFAYMKL